MSIQTTYTQARENLASLLSEVTENHETVIINRRGADPVAMISASVLSSLEETAYLFRSPKNAKRLLNAMKRSEADEIEPRTVESLRRELGLGTRSRTDPPSRGKPEAVFLPEFLEDIKFWVRTDRKMAMHALDLVEAILREPFTGIGKPEPLKHMASGCWSRRLNQEHRIVYRVIENRIHFIQCRYHY